MEFAPLFTTTDDGLVATCMALVEQFEREDNSSFGAQQIQSAFQPREQIELAEGVRALIERVAQEVDRLIAERLVANNHQVPLLCEADVSLVIRRLFAEKMDEDVRDVTRSFVAMVIAPHVGFLSAIDEDLYTAFWRFVSALFSTALEAGTTPLQAVTLLEVRNAVYRSCMTPASWQKMAEAKLAVTAGFSPSKLEEQKMAEVFFADRARQIWPLRG